MVGWRVLVVVAMWLGVSSLALGQNANPPNKLATEPQAAVPQAADPALRQQKAPVKKPTPDPAVEAVTRQSGIDQAQARNLLDQAGYNQIADLRAQPNSVWVWEADVIKDGRRVRVGIDFRGKILELSTNTAAPCTAPGIGAGVGTFGAGPRFSEVTTCAGR